MLSVDKRGASNAGPRSSKSRQSITESTFVMQQQQQQQRQQQQQTAEDIAKARMHILVKFGANETIVCNPHCMNAALLHSIKSRTGVAESHPMVDLSDDRGLILDLDGHRQEGAEARTSVESTYILLEKRAIDECDEDDDSMSIASTSTKGSKKTSQQQQKDANTNNSHIGTATFVSNGQYKFIPLLNDIEKLYPSFRMTLPSTLQIKHEKKSKARVTSRTLSTVGQPKRSISKEKAATGGDQERSNSRMKSVSPGGSKRK